MCSKINLRLCRPLLALLFGLITCAGESRPSSPAIEVELKGGGQCLSDFSREMERYSQGAMSAADVDAFWDCMTAAVSEFQRLTVGDGLAGSYTPEGLRAFLLKHFFPQRMLSDELMLAIMEIKRVLVAGSSQSVSAQDLARAKDLIGELRLITLRLRPHARVVFQREMANDPAVSAAAEELKFAARRLGFWLDQQGQSLSFAQVAGLVRAIKKSNAADSETYANLEQLERLIPALGVLKRILVGGPSDLIEATAWLPLFLTTGHVLHAGLNLSHAFQQDLNAGMIRSLVPSALEQAAIVLEAAMARRPRAEIPLWEFQMLLERVELARVLPQEFTASALRKALGWVIVRTLNEGVPTQSLQAAQVQRLRHLHRIWRNLLARVNGEPHSEIPEWAQFEAMLARTAPLTWDSEGRLIHQRQTPSAWTAESRRRLVWPFVIIHWIRASYVGNVDRMTEDELSFAVSEILPMLQKFGWMKTTKLSIGKRIVREADLFYLPSNGDFHLDMAEATHYLAFVASGLRTAQLWLAEADRLCGGRDAICLRERALHPDSRALEALPHLKAAALARPGSEFLQYMKAAEETTLGQVVTGPFTTRDILQVMMLFQYVEVFLHLYDPDKTENIDLAESLVAYQKYGPTLTKLLNNKNLSVEGVLAFYTFMMKYGDNPFTMFGGSIYFLNWKLSRNDWAFSAERVVLMGILNQLSKL